MLLTAHPFYYPYIGLGIFFLLAIPSVWIVPRLRVAVEKKGVWGAWVTMGYFALAYGATLVLCDWLEPLFR